MITLPELLQDPVYKKYFLKPPEMPTQHGLRWRVYVQTGLRGKWKTKELETYSDAFRVLKYWLPALHDGAIHSKAIAFGPPTRLVRVTRGGTPVVKKGADGKLRPVIKLVEWKPKLPEGEGLHLWCLYCRRPTIFKLFSKHHAFPRTEFNMLRDERCTICGMTRQIAGRR